ncbi:DUF4349 domain-containing protein [Microbacterium sp. B2969]|uniref:DUF4349 domain-containing protein n=1 Tax=Microbacterium alkaliflavum TaxID=3248839 RepID=A0ABW7Q5K4_9MICO
MSTPHDETPVQGDRQPDLPELTDERIAEIEQSLFAEIGRDRTSARARRRRWWIGGAAAAAVVVVAAVVSPMIVPLVSGTAGSSEVGSAPVAPAAPDTSAGSASTDESAGDSAGLGVSSVPGAADPTAGRDIITTASATVVVQDVPAATRDVAHSAEALGGYVESMSIGQSGQPIPVDPGVVYDTTLPYPTTDGAWITVRVPSDQLTTMMDQLSDLGDVTATSVNRQDVTEQTIDLQARIDATQASVDRLTQLMSQAGDLSDLIAAETALSDRQATLESYQQQLESLQSQVDMSSLTVTLTPVAEPVKADPAGFTDGLVAGWNGLVATLNGIVVALGFILPWIAVAAIVVLVVWGAVRLVRRRRASRARPEPATVKNATAKDDDSPVE